MNKPRQRNSKGTFLGPSPGPDGYRVRLAGKPCVSRATYKQMEAMRLLYGLSRGRLIDSLIEHAATCPDWRLKLQGECQHPNNEPNGLETA